MPSLLTVEDEYDGSVLIETIERFLLVQSDEKRDMFLRRYWYLDSIDAIAKRYGATNAKVKSILFRLRAALKESLEKEGFEI